MQVFRGWKASSLFLVFTTLPRTAFAARMSRVDVVDLAKDDDPNHDSPTSRVQEWVLGLGMSPPPSPPATTHSGSPPDPREGVRGPPKARNRPLGRDGRRPLGRGRATRSRSSRQGS